MSPIGVDFDRIHRIRVRSQAGPRDARLFREERLDDPSVEIIGVGVDRLDYTKGILERLDAIERLLVLHPQLRSKLAFVQIGVPSRSRIRSYAMLEERWTNDRGAQHEAGRPGDGPIRYRKCAGAAPVAPLSSGRFLRGELAARRHEPRGEGVRRRQEDLGGVLVLGELTGAARELTDALLINPYHVEGFAQALESHLHATDERARRMRAAPGSGRPQRVLWASDHRSSRGAAGESRRRQAVASRRGPPQRSEASVGERIECPRLTFGSQPKSFWRARPADICSF